MSYTSIQDEHTFVYTKKEDDFRQTFGIGVRGKIKYL